MKEMTYLKVILLVFFMLTIFSTNAQKFDGLDKSPMDVASYPSIHDDSNTIIKVVYSRPQLNGRALNKLAKNDKIWRTGANEATEIIFYTDVKFGEQLLKAGTYSLVTIPGEKWWTIILNSKVNSWGAYSYSESEDVARLIAQVAYDKNSLEAFSIAFKKSQTGVNMYLGWDTVRVSVPFGF